MKLTVERLPESRVSLDIAADETEFAQAVDKAARRVANQVVIPGFRKGKAPRAMIERLYGREVFIEEANRTLMSDLYRQAMTQEELIPVGEPEVEIVSDDPLVFKVTTAIYPSVDPGPYQDVRVETADAALTDDDVDTVIEQLRKNNSPWVDPESEGLEVGADMLLTPKQRLPREGDQVTIDVKSRSVGDDESESDEDDAVFILGESGLLDELDAAIKQLRIGESATVEITFGEDEERANADVRGKTISYTITLKGLKERDLLPIDDELARTVSDFDTLEALRDNVRNNLHREKTERLTSEVYQEIVDKMLDQATVELPAAMVDEAVHNEVHELEHRLSHSGVALDAYLRMLEQTQDELEAELEPAVTRRLRSTLLLEEVAEREGLKITQDELRNAVGFLAASMAGREPERARALVRDESFVNSVRQQLLESRLRERLIELATEGRGAVANAWTPPEPPAEETDEDEVDAGDERPPAIIGETMDALDEALTVGTMPGQPGDLAETTDLATTVADVADAEAVTEAEVAAAESDEESGGALAQPTA